MAISPSRRLRLHARKYHRLAHKSQVISKYSQKAEHFDKAAVRKHAAHVAAWIAYGPEGRIPEVEELELLKKFIDKVGAGLLPSRLNEVLPDAQAVLRAATAGQVGEGWTQAERKLRKSLRKFRCCRELADKAAAEQAADEKVDEIVKVSDTDAAETGPQPEEAVLLHVDEDDDLETTAASEQHLQLVSKMNEWGFLDDAQRVERVQQAEAAARRRRKNVSQEELAEVLNTAAAALAAPRRRATRREDDSEGSEEAKAATQPQGPKPALQRRVRALLLDALNLWRTKQYGCSEIAHVLDFVQVKISKFEDNVGEIGGAAAGSVWVSIQQAINDMLKGEDMQTGDFALRIHCGEEKGSSAERLPAAKIRAVRGPQTRLERRSGIQGISWNTSTLGWRVSWQGQDGRKRRRQCSISKFLKQGLSEEAADKSALQEAKDFREELVRQGRLQPPRPSLEQSSLVRGVSFSKKHNRWRVELEDPAERKRVNGGSFATQEEAEAKAREMALQFGVRAEVEVVPARKLSELPHFEPLGPQKGIYWNRGEQGWQSTFRVCGKTKNMRFRPSDCSEEEVAKAWKAAVAWRQQQKSINRPRHIENLAQRLCLLACS